MDLSSVSANDRQVIDKAIAAGQEHVFRCWEELNEQARQKLLRQLQQIDFKLMTRLKETCLQSADSGFKFETLAPADFISLPQTAEEKATFTAAEKVGEDALRQGRVAAFLVAGGQGSRLGFSGPKGKFPVSPVKEKTLFQLHAEKLLALMRKYDVTIPWYIMTSETNHEETVTFFEENRYFGLSAGSMMFSNKMLSRRWLRTVNSF